MNVPEFCTGMKSGLGSDSRRRLVGKAMGV